LKGRRNLYQTRNLRRLNPVLAIGIVVVLTGLGVVRGVLGNEALILIAYPVGVTLAAIAWFGNFQWKQALWAVGMMFAVYSTASMALTAQYWLAAFAVVFLLAVLIYPPIAKQTHEEVRRRRELNRH
jgi:membrane protein insertase Oxa1/YidC/SpoIIIJ